MQWISVKNDIPFEPILITNGKWVKYIEEHGWNGEKYYFHDGTGQLKNVTHFMLIPKPPKELI